MIKEDELGLVLLDLWCAKIKNIDIFEIVSHIEQYGKTWFSAKMDMSIGLGNLEQWFCLEYSLVLAKTIAPFRRYMWLTETWRN